MFQHQGIWLPDGEKHFPQWMDSSGEIVDGKGTYQIKKLRAALGYCKQFRVAVDVGAHVGLWSMQLIKRFHTVHAFEPVESFRKCWAENMPANYVGRGGPIAALYPIALGRERGFARMAVDPADTGGTHVAVAHPLNDGSDVEMLPLDGFNFDDVDFIKIDCEGYEHKVLLGAWDTIRQWKPCIIVEQKPHKLGPNFGIKGTPAVDILKDLGYKVRAELSGDFILTTD